MRQAYICTPVMVARARVAQERRGSVAAHTQSRGGEGGAMLAIEALSAPREALSGAWHSVRQPCGPTAWQVTLWLDSCGHTCAHARAHSRTHLDHLERDVEADGDDAVDEDGPSDDAQHPAHKAGAEVGVLVLVLEVPRILPPAAAATAGTQHPCGCV